MGKKRSEPRRLSTPTPFEQARDELFSHILRCGVLEAAPEHQKEWFDDTMLYLTDRYDGLDEQQLRELRVLGERYCRPVVRRHGPVGAAPREAPDQKSRDPPGPPPPRRRSRWLARPARRAVPRRSPRGTSRRWRP